MTTVTMSTLTMASSTEAEVNDIKSSDERLPLTIEELTVSWFTTIIGKPVKDATIVETIHGTAGKILFRITLEEHPDDSPLEICVKGGFNPALLAAVPTLSAIYRSEAKFYHHLAPNIKMPLPPAIYAGTDDVNGQGIVVMADLKAQGYTFGDPVEPWPVERVRKGVEQLATLHASTWGCTENEFPWTSKRMSLMDPVLGLLAPEEWNKRFAKDVRPPVPEHMEDLELITLTFKALWASDVKLNCLVHGDAHTGNTFISPDGEPGFLDWQITHVGSAMHDVPYFIIGSLSIEDRRNHEKELLHVYLDALERAGGPTLQIDDVWGEYQRQLFHGFAWVLAGPMMQSREIVDVMVERYCTAIEDHKSIELLQGSELSACHLCV